MYSDILLPTDGSEASRAAVAQAIEIADRFDATLHALYVIDTSEHFYENALDSVQPEAQEHGEKALSMIVEATADIDINTQAEVKDGVPFETINQYVEDNGIDLIVMGTHGRTGLDRVVLGSTTEKVVRTASVPVMTVRMED